MVFHLARPTLFFVAAGVSIALAASPLPEIEGRVVGVHDGDSITVLTADKTQVKIRLEGIDAPELKQAFGAKSKQALSDLIFGKQVVVRVTGHDRYRRTLSRVICGGLDVNLEMVRMGFAWRYDKYSEDPALMAAQSAARAARRGLWSDPNPVQPWEWREAKKTK